MTAKLYRHIHHGTLAEQAIEPIENRIAYIKSEKPKAEVATRLRLLKPVKNQAAVRKALKTRAAKRKLLGDDYWAKRKLLDDDYWAKLNLLGDDYRAKRKLLDEPLERLHRAECKKCPWDGKTIFPEDLE